MSIERQLKRRKARADKKKAAEELLKVPKPRIIGGKCQCGCSHVPCIGACPTFVPGGNGRCAVCDHSILCHRRKGEPQPNDLDSPLIITDGMRVVIPARRLAELQGRTCQFCNARTMKCAGCGVLLPIKEVIDVYHTGRCPKHGAMDEPCPGSPGNT